MLNVKCLIRNLKGQLSAEACLAPDHGPETYAVILCTLSDEAFSPLNMAQRPKP